MQLPRRFAEDFRGQSLLWLDLESYLTVVQLGLGADQQMHLPLSFRPRRRSAILRAIPLSLRLDLDGCPTMPTQNLERHHRRLGVTRPAAGRRPRGRMGWMEGLCSCKAGWCAGIPHCLTDSHTHLSRRPGKRRVVEMGVGHPSPLRQPMPFLIQSSLKQHSVPRVWRSQPGGGGLTRGCVSPGSMQIQL